MVKELKQNVVSSCSGNADAPILFVCEHASKYIPEDLKNLGVSDAVLNSHVAWDIGAFELTKLLSRAFDAPAVMSRVSRLVYDCNRPPSAVDAAVPFKTEQGDIPGNQNLSKEDFSKRVEDYYRPFERALAEAISNHNVAPVLVTVHSFTPEYYNKKRAVELGILHDEDHRMADALLKVAQKYTDMQVERNQPYSPEDGVTHTIREHGIKNKLHNFMIEVRNDLLLSEAQQNTVCKVLTKTIKEALVMCNIEIKKKVV